MIDKDGIERPDEFDGNVMEIKNETRKIKIDGNYPYKPRNIFFRAWCATFRALAICIISPALMIKHKMYFFGRKNIKQFRHKPFIMTCNHVSFFDDLTIGTNLFAWRKIYFATLYRNVLRPAIGFFLRSLGGIPIPVQSISGTKKFNEDISELLKENKPILYNPEGSLWPYYREIRPFKRGAFLMAVKNDVPVVPIVLLFKRKPKKNGKFKYKYYFAVCKPVEIDKTLASHAQSEKLMEEVYNTTVRVAKEWYEIQDCGFGDEKIKRVLKPRKTLFFEDDQWVVREKK